MKTKIPKGLLEHINDHVDYPATKSDIVKSCNSMEDVSNSDKKWVEKILPEKLYMGPTDVLDVLK